MKRIHRIATHLAAVAIGIAIAGSIVGFSHQGSLAVMTQAGISPEKNVGSVAKPQQGGKKAKITLASLKKSDLQEAWSSLASRPLSRKQRLALQLQILKKWAQVDLAGAMDAALKEPWDGNEDPFDGGNLMGAFAEAFTDRPLDAWALIQSGRYGAGANRFRDEWVADVSQSNGLLVISMLSEMPENTQTDVVGNCLENTRPGPERDAIMAKLIEQLAGKPDGWIQEVFRYYAGILSNGDPAALRSKWTGLPDGISRQVAMLQWTASLRNRDAGQISTELASLPPEVKADAAKLLLSQMDGDSSGVLVVIDSALSSDQWGSMAPSAAQQLSYFARTDHMDPAELAEWGTHLPQRPDTVETYQKAIGRYIHEDLSRAKGWLEEMPEGSWQRENGLAEFLRQALWEKNDLDASQWALDSITDPAVKALAVKSRQYWEEQRVIRKP